MSITTDKTQPVLVGGLVMGVLSALPIISAGNVCCCLWVISGGVVAAYLLQQNEPAPITQGDGAMIGLLAGLAGALVCWVISIPITILVGPMERRLVERIVESAGTVPPEFREMMARSQSGGFQAARFMASLIFWLFAGAVFSTLGGVLGAMFFRKALPPDPGVPPAG